jgi:hypothetical protein
VAGYDWPAGRPFIGPVSGGRVRRFSLAAGLPITEEPGGSRRFHPPRRGRQL